MVECRQICLRMRLPAHVSNLAPDYTGQTFAAFGRA